MHVRSAGVQYLRDHLEGFVESNTENFHGSDIWIMCIQGTWADAPIVQAVNDALNISIQIVVFSPGLWPITTVNLVQEIKACPQ